MRLDGGNRSVTRSGSLKLSVAALLAALVISCDSGQPGVAAPAIAPDPLLIGLPGTFLQCTPMPRESSEALIGPAGGVVTAGPHSLLIPAGALSETVLIRAVVPSSETNQVRFSPQGLTFAVPARLTMSYANCSGLLWLLPKRIVYTTNALIILENLVSVDDLLAQTVSADIDHFSKYAVAW